MHIVPVPLKPVAHKITDCILAVFNLYLPKDINLKTKFRYLFKGIDEKDLLFAITEYIKLGDCVIDVGANIGLTVRWFAQAVGNEGRVYAVEPERSNFTYLCANNIGNKSVQPHMIALSANDEIRDLILNPVSGSGNSFYGDVGHVTQKVKCLSCDTFCQQEGITNIACIKIDVEGAELDVLGGMSKTLADNPKCKLLIEYCPENLMSAGTTGQKLLDRINDLGFHPYAILNKQGDYRLEQIIDTERLLGDRKYINLICLREQLM